MEQVKKNGLVKKGLLALVIIVVVTVAALVLTDGATNENIKRLYDGVIVTDKAGNYYMLSYKSKGSFYIKGFDVTNMRVKN